MKTKHLLFCAVALMLTAITVNAQDAINKRLSVKDEIPFGKKLPPPDLTNHPDKFMPQIISTGINSELPPRLRQPDINAMKENLGAYRQQMLEQRKASNPNYQRSSANANQKPASSAAADFHLIKDINALAESNPHNLPMIRVDIHFGGGNDSTSYAVLDNVIYFVANDGIHGSEFWRSDGTAAGTYMLKDIEPGVNSSFIFEITAVNGKIYFSNYMSSGGWGVWTSDGTEKGTQLLINLGEPRQYFTMGSKVYFITDDDIGDQWSVIWETDGTPAGTKKLISLENTGAWISEPTVVKGLFFFTMFTYETGGWNLWRSDGTEAGTYSVASFPDYDNIPAQFTNYNNKLYFSASDGTGRKLWVSDGSSSGTTPAPGNNDVLIDGDKLETTFPIINNALYMPGEEASEGHGLYKYNVKNVAGLVQIKDFGPVGDTVFIVPFEMQVVNNALYFKVTNYTGGIHDELWRSTGTKATTQLVCKLEPGETIRNLYSGNGILYFVKYDKLLGTELWRTYETSFGIFPFPVSNIFKGPTSSYPSYLTAFNGKLAFSAADEKKGNELFISGGDFFNTTLVKDINTVTTTTSDAGFNSYTGYGGMAALGKDVLFNAYERVHGYELYKSDGTVAGTQLLNDVVPGEAGFFVREFLSKNNTAWFIGVSSSNNYRYNPNNKYAIYKTNGTKKSLRKITPDYSYPVTSFSVADNGLIFYVVYNYYDALPYQLWRTDGTPAGTILLSSTLYSRSYLNTVGNTAFFVAGDATNGYELWGSDGNVAGTKMVKDINAGAGGSYPKGMFIYKNEVYFAAFNGVHNSLWKSDGTKSGTLKLKGIDPYYGSTVAANDRYNFEISNNILYFSAIDTSNLKGAQIWKTDGTRAGTQVVQDINPTATSYYPNPSYFTDVNGTVFFVGDDGVHGNEIWKTDGTKEGTMLVKDITPGIDGSNLNDLTSFGGKLYFKNAETKEDGVSKYYLWSSDGTPEGTNEVEGFGISNIAAIFPSGDNLFLTVYTLQYGAELYVGKADKTGTFVASKIANKIVETSLSFNAMLYPNPVVSNALLQITGNLENVKVSVTDISGKKLWQSTHSNVKSISLPVQKFAAGTYFVTVTNDTESKTIKFVKQ